MWWCDGGSGAAPALPEAAGPAAAAAAATAAGIRAGEAAPAPPEHPEPGGQAQESAGPEGPSGAETPQQWQTRLAAHSLSHRATGPQHGEGGCGSWGRVCSGGGLEEGGPRGRADQWVAGRRVKRQGCCWGGGGARCFWLASI